MCGILGLLGPDVQREYLARCNDRLRHRGPDDVGLYQGEGIGLAACRLAIIDLAGGHQPLSNEDGTIWITHNGEIFNAPSLRAELRAAGHRFRTESDTEVIVHAYEEWGESAVARLRGMFAFGLWDAPRRRLVLARDRFGLKPLYYAEAGGHFGFASEVRPLLGALPGLPRRLNPEALERLLTSGFIPTPLTAFEQVRQLPAAHLLVVEADRRTCRQYWQLSYPPAGGHRRLTLDEAASEFTHRLREAVATWRLSDVPIGSLLSGGIDSACLAILLADLGAGPIDTFTIGFASEPYDESAEARATARFLASRHHELTFTAADFDHLPQVIRHLEAPQCSATSIPIYLLYQACHDAGFKVILTGEGADELLGGYHWFEGDRRVRPWLALPQRLRALLAQAPLAASAAARRVLAHGTRDARERHRLWHAVADSGQRAALLRLRNGQPQPPPPAPASLAGRHPLDQFLWLESQTRMIDFINFEVDRMSMAHSVEARPPFLDHELWEFCAALPPECKLSPRGTKLLLRHGLRARLPRAVARRPKRGLATPHRDWWRAERLPAWAEACLHPTALTETGYFDVREVQRLRALHSSRRAEVSGRLMAVLTTQLWHAEFVGA